MRLYDVKAKMHGESYDAVSELSVDVTALLRDFAEDYELELSSLVSDPPESPIADTEREHVILHAELNAQQGNHLSVDFVRYENNRLGIDNKVVIRAATPRGELASSVLRGLKLMKLDQDKRLALLRSELERLVDFLDYA